jgi:tryptophanyl-tRNA synthetase
MQNYSSKTVLTGDRPTGKLHLGHFVGSIQNRLKLQDEAQKAFYMIADMQALTDNADNPEKVRDNVLEVALDNLACGLDPAKTTMFIQSQISEIAELALLFMNLVTVARLEQNPTVKSEMVQKGFAMNADEAEDLKKVSLEKVRNVPAGFLVYPVSQAADILFAKANLIPVGEDQKPMIEQTNEIVDSFNRIYGEIFSHVSHLVGETPRLVGIDGNAKMSKSLNNGIYLSDSNETIEKRVMEMYTDPNHIRLEDPGSVEGNVVFQYLDIFDSNKIEVSELKAQYQKGGLGDVILKKRLIKVLSDLISPIRERREKLAQDPKAVMAILEQGTKKAREEAIKTLNEVRKAMKIDFF